MSFMRSYSSFKSIPKIALSVKEKELLTVIKNALNANSSTREEPLRIAGGWVRDKLLGLEPGDLDLALEKISGEELATSVCSYLYSNEESAEVWKKRITLNPEQSKHLSSVKFRILGLEIDANRMRKEIYMDSDSRIPIVEPGTPLEDALRRDFTINALYYNVQSEEIEDFTKCGILDLFERRIIRTCQDPEKSFKEDPLRIFRCVRFASRFEFNIHQKIIEFLNDDQARKELDELIIRKVSRERIGQETWNALFCTNSRKTCLFLEMLSSLNLFHVVFAIPNDRNVLVDPFTWHKSNRNEVDIITRNIRITKNFMSHYDEDLKPDNNFDSIIDPAAVLVCILWSTNEIHLNGSKKCQTLQEFIINSSLKLPSKFSLACSFYSKLSIRFVKVVEMIKSHPDSTIDKYCRVFEEFRKTIGFIVYDSKSSASWKQSLNIAGAVTEEYSLITSLRSWIEEESELEYCWEWAIPFNGYQLREQFKVQGHQIGALLREQTHWQIMNYPAFRKKVSEVEIQSQVWSHLQNFLMDKGCKELQIAKE